jgi:hypothetical protein
MSNGGRKKEIDKSPFRDEIRALLKDKGHAKSPTYAELAEKIEERYGESYSEGQLSTYMNEEIHPDEMMPPETAQKEIEKRRETIDIAAKRQDLVEIQERRMETTLETEEQMDGLVLDQASDMIMMYDQLLESLSKDYERLGILQSTTDIEINVANVESDPFAEMVEESIEAEIESGTDEHADYADEIEVEGDVVDSDDDMDEEEGEETTMDKEPEEIDFDDLPDQE